MKLRSVIVVAAVCVSCAATAPAPPIAHRALSDEEANAVQRAERIGAQLFAYDSIAWRATDVLDAAFGNTWRRSNTGGYLVGEGAAGWSIFFPDASGRLVLTVAFDAFDDPEPVPTWHRPPREMPPRAASMFEARQLAIANLQPICDSAYNTVVLPADEGAQNGWSIYALAATTQAGADIWGDHRVDVDNSGSTTVHNFSRSCLRIPPPPESAVYRTITHITSDEPTEIHVFRSFRGLPLFVGAGGNLWHVKGGDIDFRGSLHD